MRSLDLTQLHKIRMEQVIAQLDQNQSHSRNLNSKTSFEPQVNPGDSIHGSAGAGEDPTNPEANANKHHETTNSVEKVKSETEFEKERSKLNREKNRNSHIELQIANEKRKAAEANHRTAQANAKAIAAESKARKESSDGVWNSKVDKALKWLKIAFLLLLLLTCLIAAGLGLYYLYRFVTEEPIIEKVTVTETVEKEVIPEECTQVRRNGKVYVSCDGVTVQGAPTIAESGVDEIPELISE